MDCDVGRDVDGFGLGDIVVEFVRTGRMKEDEYIPILGWRFVGVIGSLMILICVLSLLVGCL